MKIWRKWAMPSAHTFEIEPIQGVVQWWTSTAKVIVDPFSGRSRIATHRNDINREHCEQPMDAEAFALSLAPLKADVVIFDPPYSPRQISECYKSAGLDVGMVETQNGNLYRRVKDALDNLLVDGGIAISCGWNSSGFGIERGYVIEEILMVPHGGAHNDTIVVVERKTASKQQSLL